MALRFPCPTCKRELMGPESVAGLEVQCPSCKAVFQATKRANSEPPPFLPSFPPTTIPQENADWSVPGPPVYAHNDPFLDDQAGDVGLPLNLHGDQPPEFAFPPRPSPDLVAHTTTAEVNPLQRSSSRRRRWLGAFVLLGELLIGRAFFLWRKEKTDSHDTKDRTTRGLNVAILVSMLIVAVGFALLVLLTK
jgi:phage FluMu protein Com